MARVDGWVERRMDRRRVERWMERRMKVRIERRLGGEKGGGLIYGWMGDGWIDRWIKERRMKEGRIDGWV